MHEVGLSELICQIFTGFFVVPICKQKFAIVPTKKRLPAGKRHKLWALATEAL
jgi:hypothetical protein